MRTLVCFLSILPFLLPACSPSPFDPEEALRPEPSTDERPRIIAVSPTSAPAHATVELLGEGFRAGDQVELSVGKAALMTVAATVLYANRITFELPALPPSTISLRLKRNATPVPQDGAQLAVTSGRIYYVSTSGSDSNPGTLSAPWRTLQGASSRMAPGDLVYLRGGTYSGYVAIRASGISGAPLTFTAYPGETPLLTTDSSGDTIAVFGSYITLDKLRVTNRRNPGKGITILDGAHHVTISNCEVFKTLGQGIVISGTNNLLYRNRIHDNGVNTFHDHGIYVLGGQNIIRSNVIYNNWTYGIHLYSEGTTPQGNLIEDNYVYNNGFGSASTGYKYSAGLIIARGHQNVTVRRNRFCANAHYGIITVDARPGTLLTENVTCYNRAGGIYMYTPGTNNQVQRNISFNDAGFALGSKSGVVSDWNTFYRSSGVLSFLWNSSTLDWNRYRTISGQDAHSRIDDPLFKNLPKSGFEVASASSYDFCTTLVPSLCQRL